MNMLRRQPHLWSVSLIEIPYDGGSIGKFTGDAIRNIVGQINPSIHRLSRLQMLFPIGALTNLENWGTELDPLPYTDNTLLSGLKFDASLAPGVLTANENRSASTSTLVCISY